MSYLIIILAPLLIHLVSKFLENNSILLNYSGDAHQKFVTKNKIPLSGGFFIFLYFTILFDNQIHFIIFLFLIFILGSFSDLKIFDSPKIRLLFQVSILFFFYFFNRINFRKYKNNYNR